VVGKLQGGRKNRGKDAGGRAAIKASLAPAHKDPRMNTTPAQRDPDKKHWTFLPHPPAWLLFLD